MTRKQKKVLIRIICAAILLCAASLCSLRLVAFVLFASAYLVVGYDVLLKAIRGIASLQPFDENFLMMVATVGAILLGEYAEATAVMLFYQTGELFQSVAVGKSRRSIGALMDLRPDVANVSDGNGGLTTVSPEKVAIGETVVVLPGEKIPLDGIVEEGSSSVNTAALTGESVPRSVRVGSEVQSGSVNLSGVIKVRVTKAFEESTASKILELVENASSRKSSSERFITRFARYYTPIVCLCALLLSVVPPIISILLGGAGNWGTWIYRGLSFLVISCPCALVISIPLAFFAAIGGASRAGILVKGSSYLETLSSVRCIAMDKTGTLTEGVFRVTAVHPWGKITEQELIEYAASAEKSSLHPIAKSLVAAVPCLGEREVKNVREEAGKGITSVVDGREVAVGSAALMENLGIKAVAHGGGTEVFVAVNGEFSGSIIISDVVKNDARNSVEAMKNAGADRVVMLTGDGESAAVRVRNEAGIDEAYWQLLPDGKVAALEELMNKGSGAVAFVGDGINDAPVIRRADVGIAMGGLGSDAAIEAADVVIMDDDIGKIARAMEISKKCMGIVRFNIVFAVGVKIICLLLGAMGYAGMWAAIFADVGVMVLAVLNSLRAMKIKKEK